MGTPIVDPMWFYWISVVDNVKGLFIGAAIMLLVASAIFAFCIAMDADTIEDFCESLKRFKIIPLVFLIVPFFMVVCFIPSSETLIKMEIAKHATYENTTIAIEKIEEVAKDIIHELQGDD